MSNNLSAIEQLAYSTVRIECTLQHGESSVGTGFFYAFCDNGDTYIPAIVTNKHVVEDAKDGYLSFNLKNENGDPIPNQSTRIKVERFENQWIPHPNDSVDLCILPIAHIDNIYKQQGVSLFYTLIDKSFIPNSEELDDMLGIEDIIMIGYPSGIWDKHNNMPIVRRGITATHINLDYEGKSEFMIDAACFPGSSGSPIFLYNIGGYTTKLKIAPKNAVIVSAGQIQGDRVKLVGILYAGPQFTVNGDLELIEIPTKKEATVVSEIPMNLGMVIKAHELFEFEHILEGIEQKHSE